MLKTNVLRPHRHSAGDYGRAWRMAVDRRNFLRFAGAAAINAVLGTGCLTPRREADVKSAFFTEQEIRARLGVSTTGMQSLWPVAEEQLGERHFAQLRALGISKLEVTQSCVPARIRDIKPIAQGAKNQGIEIVAVHGLGGKFSSAYEDGLTEKERTDSVQRASREGEKALELGASIILFHFGTTESSAQSVGELLEFFKGTPLILGGENVGRAVSSLKDSDEVADFVRFADRIDSDRYGLVLDLGHARDADGVNPFLKEEAAYKTVILCRRRLIHLHLQDTVQGMADPHYPPFDGQVRWLDVFQALYDIEYPGCFMFEPVHDGYHGDSVPSDTLRKVGTFPRRLIVRGN